MNYELHPLCTFFPRMSGHEFECLVLDIKENGLRTPITLYSNMILDGGNRYAACVELGITPMFEKFIGDDIGAFVLTSNLHRRHLTPGQQSAIVACIQDWSKAHPANRQKKGATIAPLSTVADRAAQSGASIRTQKTADRLAREAPELAAAVGRGEISLPKAEKQAFPKPQFAPAANLQNHKPEESPEYDGSPSEDELAASLADEQEMFEEFKRCMELDDPLAQALKDVTKFKEIARIATERFNGLQNEKNELIRMVKGLQAKLKKAGIK